MKSLGIDWFAAWFAALLSTLSLHSSGSSSPNTKMEYDILNTLRDMPIIPLSDGSYGSISDGPIWLPCDMWNIGSKGEYCPEDFPCIYNKLKMVNPHLFSVAKRNPYSKEEIKADIVMQMLLKIGAQQLSAHEVIRSHVLVGLTEKNSAEDRELMVEYLSFIMLHIQFDCVRCQSERTEIILELQKKPVLLTNRGYSCPLTEPVHFGKEYGNPLDIAMLLDVVDVSWVVVDPCYLKHPVTQLVPSGLLKWRDWESPELVHLLSIFSSKGYRAKCMFLLEVLDKLWDDVYHSQAISLIISKSDGTKKPIVSSFMKCIQKFSWIPSTLDKELHQPESVFYDCEQVQSILGIKGPYACPQVNSKLLVKDIGFKVEVSIDDAVEVLRQWRVSGSPFVGWLSSLLNPHDNYMKEDEFSFL
ncbi:hypothetical protein HPP92_028130 [Vanilla planifolia]|uniref:Uncharacterized protein n=1 Tax=Vanilla planifolia TaxID=51239 RepID=A0A835P6H8_VANPL|nr:hypothetical protein HPP92_028130 [Vanilla planifolia]